MLERLVMPGKRVTETSDFITPRRVYREDVVDVDSGVTDVDVPILDGQELASHRQGLGQSDIAQYGRNAQLDLACILEGFSSVTMQLWLWAEVELPLEQGTSSSSYGVLPTSEEWVYVAEKTISKSELWVVKDIPPGQYKVIVTSKTGSGHLQIREQHAA
jgi:hypothetical protein